MKRNQSGVSLIELMVALTVIAIALLQVVGVIVHTMSLKETTREKTIATSAATEKIEEMKVIQFDSLVITYQDQQFDVEGLTNINNVNNLGQGTVFIDDSNADLLDVTVTVQWEGAKGMTIYRTKAMITR